MGAPSRREPTNDHGRMRWSTPMVNQALSVAARHRGNWHAAAAELSGEWGRVVTYDQIVAAVARHHSGRRPNAVLGQSPTASLDPLADLEEAEQLDKLKSRPPPKEWAESYLIISDTQIPFEASRALEFCLDTARRYAVPEGNVYHVGDEVDAYFGSLYDKDPDARHTPNSELEESRARLRRWYRVFPQMRLCRSNHGDRWIKKAYKAQIPSQLLRSYREVLEAPPGWTWEDSWLVRGSKHTFKVIHGHRGAGGMYSHRTNVLDNGCSVVHGHTHASAGITPIRTESLHAWGMNVGCLIDNEQYAFHYNKGGRFAPWLGVGVVLDGGRVPLLVPYD